MRILLITSTARGHAIAEALARSREKPELFSICQNRNPGLRALAAEQFVMDIMDFEKILEIARIVKPSFAVIGPDDPIGRGLADALQGVEVPCVAPTAKLARIESSKGFAREVLKKYGIDASPKFRVFTKQEAAKERKRDIEAYLEDELHTEYVVKYDGLRGGKGVKLSGEHLTTITEGAHYALQCIEEGGQVVIEEKLSGAEFSLMSFVSGVQVVHMPAVQDHKRAYEGNTGPNTGGMGSYSDPNHSLPFLSQHDLERAKEINHLTAEALLRECGELYKGILYGGYMAVADGVRLLEFNARFGDPEALNVLPLLESDFVTICQAMIEGELTDDLVRFAPKATVCKYITPHGYPENKDQRGKEVVFPEEIPENARLYFGDISEEHDGRLLLGGSRTAGIVGIGKTVAEAELIAQKLCEEVQGPVRFRSDIGTHALIGQTIRTIKHLRQADP